MFDWTKKLKWVWSPPPVGLTTDWSKEWKKLLKIFANALNNLNIKFAWIVNSEDGLDEISPYAKTNVVQLKDGRISEIIIDPIAIIERI